MSEADSDIVVTGKPIRRGADEVTIIVDDVELSGWEEVEITLRAEGFPNSFAVAMSIHAPAEAALVSGNACTVLLGNDVVVTGYVDRLVNGGTATTHSIALAGRGKSQDLVDCSAEWPTHQIIQGDALTIARQVALPYGIAVELGEGASAGEQVPQWNLNYGETGAEIIQRVARNAGLLAYEDARGRVLLADVGTTNAASGVVYGKNVQGWQVETSMDGRYSEIVCCLQSMDVLMELAGDDFYHSEPDPNVPRHRQLDIVMETSASDPMAFTIKRARWEAARRAGRAHVVHATVDSWRDEAGTPWTPNTLVNVDVPGSQIGTALVLGEVTFRRTNESGTTAELVLMPRQAFTPEPIVLQPLNTAEFVPAPSPGTAP